MKLLLLQRGTDLAASWLTFPKRILHSTQYTSQAHSLPFQLLRDQR